MNYPIMDKRYRTTKFALKLWKIWSNDSSVIFKFLSAFSSKINEKIIENRISNRIAISDNPKVISIGNISVGGSGKTPLAIKIASDLLALDKRVAILVRGYGSNILGPFIVDSQNSDAGDEAREIAEKLPNAVVVQSRDRFKGYSKIKDIVDYVIIEDGFQTAGLFRHLDMVILDRYELNDETLIPKAGKIIPWGPYRESESAINRADCIFVNIDSNEKMPTSNSLNLPMFSFTRQSRLEISINDITEYAIISGISNPEQFEKHCINIMGLNPVIACRYDDHHSYSKSDIFSNILSDHYSGVTWLTTAKDQVKLREILPDNIHLEVVNLHVDWVRESPLQFILNECQESNGFNS
jgi:tetraacyldisaccharide 4'-kinase